METWSSVLSEFAFLLWAEMDPANRQCLTSQAVRGIWIGGCGCSPGKRYQKIRTCLTREVETSSSPIRLWDIRRRWNKLFRTSLSGATPSGFPKRTRGALPYPDSLREKNTALMNITPRTIAYPIRICCPDHWLKWASLATAHVPPPSDDVSGRPVWTSLQWIPKNSPQSRIALVIKKLSKHQNLTQFDYNWLQGSLIC